MGDRVQNKSVKAIDPDASVAKRDVLFRCGKGEYLHINEDGRRVCLEQEPLGGFQSAGITCGEKGGFPCDFGRENIGVISKRPPPQTQSPSPKLNGLKKIIAGQAEYRCRTIFPFVNYWTITQGVSISDIPGEPEEETRARLEQAARDLAKTIGGCRQVKFRGLQTTSQTSPEPKAQVEKASESARTWHEALKRLEEADPCRPGGKWVNRKICQR